MKASEYIKAMQALIDEHGDLDVFTTYWDGDIVVPEKPEVRYANRRNGMIEFYYGHGIPPQGEKVIRV